MARRLSPATQRKIIAEEYRANGYIVTEDAPGSMLGLDIPGYTLDLVCQRGDENMIVDFVHHLLDADDATARFVAIREAIENRPEIEYEIRMSDISANLDSFVKALVKLRNDNPNEPAFQQVLDLAEKFGI